MDDNVARYSPVAPIILLEELFEKDLLGDYLLLLAHDVVRKPHAYERLIGLVRDRSPDSFIIMDNSLIELGEAMDAEAVIEAASIVNADALMTPDSLGGLQRTKELVRRQANLLLSSGFPLMRVPQGKDNEELIKCVQWLREILPTEEGTPEYWGIPRWIANEIGSRVPICQYIFLTDTPETPSHIHLLGTSKNHEDDIRACYLDHVMGIDSANPLVCGQNGWNLAQKQWKHMPRKDYWKHKELAIESIINVEYMREVIQYP